MKVAHVMVGVAGSGKSTYAKSLGLKIISSDDIREKYYSHLTGADLHNSKVNEEVFSRAYKMMSERKTSFVFDATNLSRKARINLYKFLKKLDFSVNINIVIEPLSVILKQNKMRKNKVPKEVVKRMYLTMQPPKIGVDCDSFKVINRHPFLSEKPYREHVGLMLSMKANGIADTLENFVNKEWLEELSNIQKPHETPYHLESIDEHINMCFENSSIDGGTTIDDTVLSLVATLHDLGKSVTKKRGTYYGHENVSSMYALLMLSELYDIFEYGISMSNHLIIVVVETILYHMIAHKGISPKVNTRYKLTSTELVYLDTFADIDNRSRITDANKRLHTEE